jgi:hypothetical protein
VVTCIDGDYVLEKTISVKAAMQALESLMDGLLVTQERLTAEDLQSHLLYTDTRWPPELRSYVRRYQFEVLPLRIKPGSFAAAHHRTEGEDEGETRVTVEVASGLESSISGMLMEAVVDESVTAVVLVARPEEFK